MRGISKIKVGGILYFIFCDSARLFYFSGRWCPILLFDKLIVRQNNYAFAFHWLGKVLSFDDGIQLVVKSRCK